jgi:hypothetical protein
MLKSIFERRMLKLSGIPCHHVLACCINDRINLESLVHSCYSRKAYAHKLHPLRGRTFWKSGSHVTTCNIPVLATPGLGFVCAS